MSLKVTGRRQDATSSSPKTSAVGMEGNGEGNALGGCEDLMKLMIDTSVFSFKESRADCGRDEKEGRRGR